MKPYDMITMCLQNLFRRRMRTMLTVIGVVVGTCAIVVMISIGIGMKESQEAMLAQMGDLTIIEIYAGGANKDGEEVKLTDELLTQINSLSEVIVATPFYYPYQYNMSLVAGKNDRYESYLNLVGIYPEALPYLGFEALEGDITTALQQPYSMVFGQYADYNFSDSKKREGYDRVYPYPDENGEIPSPLLDVYKEDLWLVLPPQDDADDDLRVEVEVTARLVEDYGKGYETSRGIFMSVHDLYRIEEQYRKENNIRKDSDEVSSYDNAKVKVHDISQVEAVELYIQDMGFYTYSMESIRKPMEEQARQQQMILGSLGAISLFVAAIGITNTMVMSIYERTREIGVMKVIGCSLNDIRTIFLMEAGLIGFGGGVLGIGVSYIISFLMNHFGLNINLGGNMFGGMSSGEAVSVIPTWLVGMAIVFATVIGLVSGYYPANRAVKISALSAIKQDG